MHSLILRVRMEAGPVCPPLQMRKMSVEEVGNLSKVRELGNTGAKIHTQIFLKPYQQALQPHPILWDHMVGRILRNPLSPRLQHGGNIVLEKGCDLPAVTEELPAELKLESMSLISRPGSQGIHYKWTWSDTP